MESEPPQKHIILAYIGLILIWSSTPLSVVLSLRDLDAVWALTIRLSLAAVLASLILRLSGQRLERSREALLMYGTGAMSMFGAMFFTYLGARHLPSGLISMLFGSSPLMVGVLSLFLLPGTRLHALQWLGLLLGIAGLACMFWQPGSGARIDLLSVIYILLGVASYVVSVVLLRRRGTSLPPLMQTVGALWISVACCLLVLPFFWSHRPVAMPGWVSLGALLFSICMGSIVAMLCYFFLAARISPSTVSLTTLINPVFALLLGMTINHEHFRPETLLGMALIFMGLLAYYARDLRALWGGRALATAEAMAD